MAKKGKAVIVQIYEIQNRGEAEKLLAMGVDHIGSVILSGDEWKDPEIRATIELVSRAGGRSSLIPLFSDLETILRAADYHQPHILHFCEDLVAWEEKGRTAELMETQQTVKERRPDLQIMRSIPIAAAGATDSAGTLELARVFEPASDYFLTDTRLAQAAGSGDCEQPVTGFVGITGRICQWDTAARLVAQSRIPVVLAGGISPGNVFDGILRTRPAGVDSCTCTNRMDPKGRPIRFQKDFARVARLISEVRRAERELETISA